MRRLKKKITKDDIVGMSIKACGAAVFFALVIANAVAPFGRVKSRADTGMFRLCFLDAGEADCTIALFPNGDCLVVDAGDGSYDLRRKTDAVLSGIPAEHITYVATHSDYDHIGGMADALLAYGGAQLYLPALSSDLRAYKRMVEAAKTKDVPAKVIKRYETRTFGDAYFVCLSPYSQGEEEENDSSAVIYLSYAGVNILLCGDISSTREEILRSEYILDETLFDSNGFRVRLDDVDILKVAHHGSGSSSSAEWLGLLSPEVSVISCGAGNSYGHPAGEALARLAACGSEIYRTDELGTITVTVSPDGTYTTAWEK